MVPTTFTTRVMARSTKAAYIKAPTSSLPASGKWLASSAASVFAGENIDQLMTLALPASMARAIVSPSARPKPRITAPKIPVEAVGTITARIASQRVAPSPNAASRIFGGTSISASREIAEIVGVPVGTVKSRLHAALERLQTQWKAAPTAGEV